MSPFVPGILDRLGRTLVAGILGGWALTARPQAVISEFLADNASGLRDEDGDTSDWIEIGNASPVALDLAGWRLTDRAESAMASLNPPGR